MRATNSTCLRVTLEALARAPQRDYHLFHPAPAGGDCRTSGEFTISRPNRTSTWCDAKSSLRTRRRAQRMRADCFLGPAASCRILRNFSSIPHLKRVSRILLAIDKSMSEELEQLANWSKSERLPLFFYFSGGDELWWVEVTESTLDTTVHSTGLCRGISCAIATLYSCAEWVWTRKSLQECWITAITALLR